MCRLARRFCRLLCLRGSVVCRLFRRVRCFLGLCGDGIQYRLPFGIIGGDVRIVGFHGDVFGSGGCVFGKRGIGLLVRGLIVRHAYGILSGLRRYLPVFRLYVGMLLLQRGFLHRAYRAVGFQVVQFRVGGLCFRLGFPCRGGGFVGGFLCRIRGLRSLPCGLCRLVGLRVVRIA